MITVENGAPKRPKPPKTTKDTFELPANFKVVEHKTEKNSWKSYQGPDGKNFRSMAEVKKHLAKVNNHLESSSNLVDTIKFVATEWNSTEDGDPARNINKFYWTDVKNIPKTDLY